MSSPYPSSMDRGELSDALLVIRGLIHRKDLQDSDLARAVSWFRWVSSVSESSYTVLLATSEWIEGRSLDEYEKDEIHFRQQYAGARAQIAESLGEPIEETMAKAGWCRAEWRGPSLMTRLRLNAEMAEVPHQLFLDVALGGVRPRGQME